MRESVTGLLRRVADKPRVGKDALCGAIVLVQLDRTIDRLIQVGLGLGPYHRGSPSPWSHCFMVAESFKGAETRILDCTIRGRKNEIVWDNTSASVLELFELIHQGIKRMGGIYSATLGDYDDRRVELAGVIFLKGLSLEQRQSIVDAGARLSASTPPYRYDIPGLLRELFRLAAKVPVRADRRLLFCSSFCQKAYRMSGVPGGDLAPEIAAVEDVTPDDLWYSSSTAIARYPRNVPVPSRP